MSAANRRLRSRAVRCALETDSYLPQAGAQRSEAPIKKEDQLCMRNTVFPKKALSCTLIGMKIFLRLCLCFSTLLASAQHLVKQEVFDAIANEYSGEAAQENTRRIVEYHRIQGSPMMAAVAEQVVLPRLKAAGLEASIEQFVSDGKTKYGTYISPMGWDMRGGELWVDQLKIDRLKPEGVAGAKGFKPIMLCRYADVPMCVSTYSKGGDWSGELVDVGNGTSDANYQGTDVRSKVVLASGYAANVVREAVLKHGAVGVVIPRPAIAPTILTWFAITASGPAPKNSTKHPAASKFRAINMTR
jgi:hypothetical protein